MAIHDDLPALYERLLPACFEKPLAKESASTCSNCAMCSSGDALPGLEDFAPDVKCCSYYPNLPNYLVGGLLEDAAPEHESGRERVREKIAKRVGVSPFGVQMPRKYDLIYGNLDELAFGRSHSMVCPYFDTGDGGCTIWRFRNGVCSTWFCKINQGQDGKNFWDALKSYLGEVETVLARAVLLRLDWDPEIVAEGPSAGAKLSARDVDDLAPDDKTYRALWRDWVDREEPFYLRAHEIVSGFTRKDLAELGGVRLRARQALLEQRYDRMQRPDLPERLQVNPKLSVVPADAGRFYLYGYSSMDPLRTSQTVIDLVRSFDGRRPVAEIVDRFPKSVPRSLIVKLYQSRILVGVD